MTKLKYLSTQTLANLLDLPLDKARRWLQVAEWISETPKPTWLDHWFGDFESATYLRRFSVEGLMELSVEEVQRCRKRESSTDTFPISSTEYSKIQKPA